VINLFARPLNRSVDNQLSRLVFHRYKVVFTLIGLYSDLCRSGDEQRLIEGRKLMKEVN
jgi:hypothetical protein